MKKILNIKEPDITSKELKEVLNCVKKSEISTYGKLANNIGKDLSIYSNAKYNLPLNSGSAALLLGLKSLGVKKGDIIITQSFTFGATTNAILNAKAKPWLFDVDKFSLSLDLNQLQKQLENKTFSRNGQTFLKKKKQRVYAICPVTSFGIIPNLLKIKKIANKYNLKIIIDAACAFGNKYHKKSLSKFADIVVYSFNGNKNFTAGGGGALSTDKKNLFNKAKILSENGKFKGNYNYIAVGHNYKMTNIHAAILKSQLFRFKEIKKKIYFNFKKYKKNINNQHLNFFFNEEIPNNISWLNFVLCKSENTGKKLINYLKKNKVNTDYFWKPMHLQPIKKYFIWENMKFTEKLYKRIVLIPSSSFIKKKEINYVINLLNNFKNE